MRQNALSCRRIFAAATEPEAETKVEGDAAESAPKAKKLDIKTIVVGQILQGTVVSWSPAAGCRAA